MNKNTWGAMLLIGTAMAWGAAIEQRQATMRGGGSPNDGKCTVEVVVDGSAEVQISGASATLRTTGGQPAQWRRFECTGPMPANPVNFRFAGVDGRGRQDLIRDPRNGGGAVIAISDPDGGSEGYTFDVTWGVNDGGPGVPPGGYRDYGEDRYRPNYRDSPYYQRYGHPFAMDDAIELCRTQIFAQAQRRFRGSEIHVRRTDIDDQPGRRDWVVGSLDIHRSRPPRTERYNFSCSVNFNNGRVLTANIDPVPLRF